MGTSNETTKGGGFKVARLFFNDGRCNFSGTGAPVDGTTGAGFAGIGSEYTRLSNAARYVNTGTKASPVWTLVGTVADGSLTTAKYAAASVTSAKVDPLLIQFASIALTAAQIKAMKTTPVAVLASPGAGKYYIVHRAALAFTYGAVQMAAGGVVSLVDHGGHNAVHTGGVPAATLQAAASSYTDLGGLAGANGNVRPAATGIDIEAATADFTTGDSTARVHIWYSTAALTS